MTDDLTVDLVNTFTLNTVKWPLNISFSDIGSLKPTEDITAREAVLLQMMLCCSSVNSYVDFPLFVKENKLERHFK